ncbi:MAG: DoxX family protein [Cyclobacteriaceae bacterium]
MNRLKSLLRTDNDLAPFIARVFLGFVIFPHGAQKIVGIWGGHGLQAMMDSFQAWFGIHPVLSVLVALAEFFGSLALIVGFFGRFMAASLVMVMLGAIYYVVNDFFFMNWYSEQRGEGFEFHLLAIGLGLVVIVKGSGKYALDRWIYSKLK